MIFRAHYTRSNNAAPQGATGKETGRKRTSTLELPAVAAPLHTMTFGARNAALAANFAYTILQSYVDSIGGSWIFYVETLHGRK